MSHRAPTATAADRAHVGSPPAGDSILSHLLPVQGLVPRPRHRRRAEGGGVSRPSPEAVSSTRPPVTQGPTTASNPEEEPPNRQGGFCGCRGFDQNRGLPSRGPKSTRRGHHMVPDPHPQMTVSCLASLAPLPHGTSALPTTLTFQTSAKAWSSGNQLGEQAPAPGTRANVGPPPVPSG